MTAAETISGIRARLDAARGALRAAVDPIAPALRRERPQPDRWSVAEVVEHLAIVEGWVARLLGRATADASTDAPLAEAQPLRPALVIDRSRRVEAVPMARPSGTLDWEQAWTLLAAQRGRLLDVLDATDPDVVSRVRAAHFLFGVLDGFDWLRFVAAHEQRHTLQVEEIGRALATKPTT